LKRRIGILTGGGDVPPLNAVIGSAYRQAESVGVDLVGIARGWQGLFEMDLVDLSRLSIDLSIGGTVLKSSRVNLNKVDGSREQIQRALSRLGLDGLIVVGGEDTLSNAFLFRDVPQVLISKTIDNDVGINEPGEIVNYFTLGYPTAAQKISSLVSLKEGLRTTAYSHERIMVVESMGMHAGWLALASSMGHPDFIIIPEFPLNYDLLMEKVVERYRKERSVLIVVSEGARWENGEYISADESEKDNFGHPRFKGGAESLAKRLKTDLKTHFDTRNVNAVNPSYIYRAGKPNQLDYNSAILLGKEGVDLFSNGISEPVLLTISDGKDGFKAETIDLRGQTGIDKFHRFVDSRYYDPAEFQITPEGKSYLSKIVSEVDEVEYGAKREITRRV
jgi:6-phosphofructokinase 1